MIHTVDLEKRFSIKEKRIIAVNKANLDIETGEIFGLLGPNGAGKTTFFRLLSCLLQPTFGTATVAGYDIVKEPTNVRKRVGLLCEEPSLYEKQTIHDNLWFFGELYRLERRHIEKRISELSGTLNFTDLLPRKPGTLSKGQRQRVSLARALLHEPEVLLLDEPTANLDPETASSVRLSIKELQKDEKRTIIVSSHNLDEVEKLCGRVSIIDNGKVIRTGSVTLLRDEFSAKSVLITYVGILPDTQSALIEQIQGVQEVRGDVSRSPGFDPSLDDANTLTHHGLEVVFASSASDQRVEEIISEVVRVVAATRWCNIVSVTSPKKSLEDVYLKLLHDRSEGKEESR